MTQLLYMHLKQTAPVAAVIFPIAVMLLSGFLMTRITKMFRLPSVTAYILAGILIGPFCLDLVPGDIIEGTEFVADIALALIAFSTGEFFRLSVLRKGMGKVVVITLTEALMASLTVFLLTRWVFHLEFGFSIVLAALASATAPASTMMTIRQTGAKGEFVDTLLKVIAFDDIVALLAYSIAISVSRTCTARNSCSLLDVLIPLGRNLGVLLLGALFGVLMKLLIREKRSDDNRLILAIALLLGFCGICAGASVSPLLGCMSMGTVYINLTGDERLFRQLNDFSPPVLLLFFVRAGVSFDLEALIHCSGSVAGVPLIAVGGAYFLVRILGKYSGARLGCRLTGKPAAFRTYFGLALIPQAGVAIGLAAMGARELGGDLGEALQTVILASSVLYELMGPACAKLALYRSGSYSVPEKFAGVRPGPMHMRQGVADRTLMQSPGMRRPGENKDCFPAAAPETARGS